MKLQWSDVLQRFSSSSGSNRADREATRGTNEDKMRLKFGDEISRQFYPSVHHRQDLKRPEPQKLRTTSPRKEFEDDSQSQNAKAKVRIELDFCSDTGYK